jgi:hypothetical protein
MMGLPMLKYVTPSEARQSSGTIALDCRASLAMTRGDL